MGNGQAYADYWSKLQRHMRDSAEVDISDQNFTVTNTQSYKTYYVTKRLLHSSLLFLATDESDAQVFLKIYELDSFEEVKKLHIYLKQVQEKLSDTRLVKVLDYFFTYEKGDWVFVVVEELVVGFTLENWLEYLSSDLIPSKVPASIPPDRAVCAFFDIVKRVHEAHEKGFVLTTISTTNIMLERTKTFEQDAVLNWEGESYVMKVAPYKVPGGKIPNQFVPPEGLTNRPAYDIWCCGVVLLCVSAT
jgi:serine/threonine protein kinase